jgi:hypothetical protein
MLRHNYKNFENESYFKCSFICANYMYLRLIIICRLGTCVRSIE